MITLLAFLTMFIDHMGLIFFPYEDIWRVIGRIAFPLFAWGIVRGYKNTSDKFRYAKRIFILAIISQIPVFFLGWDLYNVCFTLLFGLMSLFILEEKNIPTFLKLLFITGLLAVSDFLKFDYGMYGVLTIILLYFTWQKKVSVLHFTLLTFLFYGVDYTHFNIEFHIQFFAILAPILLYFTPIQKYDFKINFWVKYGFYPVHLALLYGIFLLI